MSHNRVNIIVNYMAPNSVDSTIQRIQTEHRLKLAEFWNIKEGSKVLEIGCGQGDTTAVLAYLVGDKGFVHGVDIASPDYGSPITVGDSIDYLKKSPIGDRIKVDFGFDVLSPKVDFPESYFDVIVLSHCSWYMKSVDELQDILKKSKKWGKTLCFAEWDTTIKTVEQYPHFLAVLIQAQYECFKKESLSNVRTLFTPMDVKHVAETTGWRIMADTSFDSPDLQDGKWEVQYTLAEYKAELKSIDEMPPKFTALIESEINILKAAVDNTGIKPMSTFTFIAE
ncbi:methyltransferase domain-containing protein [Paenisporosarcina indica]|uniref:methyltransferase domain-containing protein n=1 Tax=Paenisporosarcina indica TaxID=650093 RepID=UPI00094FC3F6|nr:methyltransferase domain-containing protein [Paenisporosarcina indica]